MEGCIYTFSPSEFPKLHLPKILQSRPEMIDQIFLLWIMIITTLSATYHCEWTLR